MRVARPVFLSVICLPVCEGEGEESECNVRVRMRTCVCVCCCDVLMCVNALGDTYGSIELCQRVEFHVLCSSAWF